jgi:hypothetical protein
MIASAHPRLAIGNVFQLRDALLAKEPILARARLNIDPAKVCPQRAFYSA